MTLSIPICVYCRHHRTEPDGGYCAAFPDGDGIPEDILSGRVAHYEPVRGDHGIQFEPSDAEAAKKAEWLFGPAPVAATR